MSLRTPLGRVRGLGSAKSGTHHFWIQRVTAIALIPLTLWFIYCVVVAKFAAYVAGLALAPGAPYMTVFRITGTVAFAGYALALAQHSIWYQRSWMTTARSMFDGLVYALLTAGTFGWLWPE